MADAPDGIRSATREDLLTAMQREAFAYASYMLFAGTARNDGAAGAFTTAREDDVAHLESFREALLDVSP